MMILRMAVYFVEQVERERGLFISFASVVRWCCCCVEIWWIPRGICKLISEMVVWQRYIRVLLFCERFDPPKTGNICTERQEFSLRIVLVPR